MITQKEKTYKKMVYVTSDGSTYLSYKEAQRHEDSLIPNRPMTRTYCSLENDDTTVDLILIKSNGDLEYCQAKEWYHNASIEYDGPGWYIVFRHSGGDYDDTYDVLKLDNYISTLQKDIKNLKEKVANI